MSDSESEEVGNILQKTQRMIKRYKSLLKSTMELNPHPIIILDIKGFIRLCNEATCRKTGIPRKEIIGKHFEKLPFLQKSEI
ncbi:MAG: PAS domain-containing protein, partial [Candidatus Thorarchaeota archaeon]